MRSNCYYHNTSHVAQPAVRESAIPSWQARSLFYHGRLDLCLIMAGSIPAWSLWSCSLEKGTLSYLPTTPSKRRGHSFVCATCLQNLASLVGKNFGNGITSRKVLLLLRFFHWKIVSFVLVTNSSFTCLGWGQLCIESRAAQRQTARDQTITIQAKGDTHWSGQNFKRRR